ncbi:Probable receptor-like serine/threonine-protein kinase At5g57670 [Linum perenne]
MKYIRTNSLKRLFSLIRRTLEEQQQHHLSIGPPILNLNLDSPHKPTWKCFSYDEISLATNSFDPNNIVGRGGYAEVYRGTLPLIGEVAVKRLTKSCTDERKEKEFLMEIGTIGHVNHPNVLPLVGCCIDSGLYLIFRYSSVGSLASLLHGKPGENWKVLDWGRRYKIAIGTAKGINYLHKGCQRRIIHRDIKSSNVLLTEDYEPLISDFGLAKWLPSQWSHHSIGPIEGTFGHLAPEYYLHGIVDEKTDVFAFGVLLLELISGKKPVDGSHLSLHSWVSKQAKPVLKRGEVEELADPRLGGEYDVREMRQLAFAASLCIRPSPAWRPTMSEVLTVMVDEGEMGKERWKMGEEEEQEQDEFWGFEDLECDTCTTSPISSSSINNSPTNSFNISMSTPTPIPS